MYTLTSSSLVSCSNCIGTETEWSVSTSISSLMSSFPSFTPPCSLTLGKRHLDELAGCNLFSFLFLGDNFFSSQWKMVITYLLLNKRKSHHSRGRIEYITSCSRYLLPRYFGKFRVRWPLIFRKIHHMGSNISEIRISFVIIAKSYRTTSVIWHENKLFSQFAICI